VIETSTVAPRSLPCATIISSSPQRCHNGVCVTDECPIATNECEIEPPYARNPATCPCYETEFENRCVTSGSCELGPFCYKSADCAAGTTCILKSCCTTETAQGARGVCVETRICANAAAPRRLFRRRGRRMDENS